MRSTDLAVVVLGILAITQDIARPSLLTRPADPPVRNIVSLYSDEAFRFVGGHYGDGRDPAGATEPGLFVYSDAAKRWLQITAISTAGGRFGYSSAAMVVSVMWDFTPYAKRLYIEVPLKSTGSIMFPDRIEYDRDTERFRLRHSSGSSSRFPEAETALYIRRADLVQAFGRSAVYLR
jgi:hypothetical protein